MSRRTKLLITALFLVLLAVPVVYLFLSWSPVDPLEFRLIEATPLDGDPFLPNNLLLTVEMKNTSSVPIRTYEAHLHLATVKNFAFINVYHAAPYIHGKAGGSGTMALQPGEVRSCTGSLLLAIPAGQNLTDAVVECRWTSQVKTRGFDLAYWLQTHLPSPLDQCVPFPEADITTAPLLK